MQKCKELASSLLEKLAHLAGRSPKVVSGSVAGTAEGYELSYAAGTVTVKAQSPLAEVYALGLLNVIIPSGLWHEYLGPSSPRYTLRPLWLRSPPASEDAARESCCHAAERGYNALAWSGMRFSGIPRQYGLKFIVEGCEPGGDADYLIWTAKPVNDNPEATLADQLVKEMRAVENRLPPTCKLILYVPCEGASLSALISHTLLALCRESSPGTCIAFPAVAGSPTHDHLPPHPLWETLRSSPQLLGVGLLPVLNAGAVGQGEGLWPAVSFDQAEFLLGHCRRHSFAGAAGVVSSIGSRGGFLDANLWVAGQAMWRDLPPTHLLDAWLRAYKKESLDPAKAVLFKTIRAVALATSRFRWLPREEQKPEEWRHHEEEALLHVRWLEAKCLELEKGRTGRASGVSVADYLAYFLRDAKRALKYAAPGVNINDDGQESLWSRPPSEGRSSAPPFVDTPNAGHPASKLAAIRLENS